MSLVYLLYTQFCVPHYFCKNFAMHFRSRYILCRRRNKSVSCKPVSQNLLMLSLECNAEIVLRLRNEIYPVSTQRSLDFRNLRWSPHRTSAQRLVLWEFLIPQIPSKRRVLTGQSSVLQKLSPCYESVTKISQEWKRKRYKCYENANRKKRGKKKERKGERKKELEELSP